MDAETSAVPLTRQQASDAVTALGWRYLLGRLCTSVPVASLAEAVDVAALAVTAGGEQADGHLLIDLRPDAVVLTVHSDDCPTATTLDVALARHISAALDAHALLAPGEAGLREVQLLEIAIDALDIAVIRPFWRAVLGYVGTAGTDGPTDPLEDPRGRGPWVWFQQMDRPRPQRNRIHLDICVPHDQAQERLAAALGAGGRLVADNRAPAWWVLADAEGNEACITTWQARD